MGKLNITQLVALLPGFQPVDCASSSVLRVLPGVKESDAQIIAKIISKIAIIPNT